MNKYENVMVNMMIKMHFSLPITEPRSLDFGLTTLERSYFLITSFTISFSSLIVKMAEGIKTPPKFDGLNILYGRLR